MLGDFSVATILHVRQRLEAPFLACPWACGTNLTRHDHAPRFTLSEVQLLQRVWRQVFCLMDGVTDGHVFLTMAENLADVVGAWGNLHAMGPGLCCLVNGCLTMCGWSDGNRLGHSRRTFQAINLVHRWFHFSSSHLSYSCISAVTRRACIVPGRNPDY